MSPAERTRLQAKRRKLAALAERGVDGERDNARRMLAAFDQRHPELTAPPFTGPRGTEKTYNAPPHSTVITVNVNGRQVHINAAAMMDLWINLVMNARRR